MAGACQEDWALSGSLMSVAWLSMRVIESRRKTVRRRGGGGKQRKQQIELVCTVTSAVALGLQMRGRSPSLSIDTAQRSSIDITQGLPLLRSDLHAPLVCSRPADRDTCITSTVSCTSTEMTGPPQPGAAPSAPSAAPAAGARGLSEEMRRVIYGEVSAEEKDKAYQGSLQRLGGPGAASGGAAASAQAAAPRPRSAGSVAPDPRTHRRRPRALSAPRCAPQVVAGVRRAEE